MEVRDERPIERIQREIQPERPDSRCSLGDPDGDAMEGTVERTGGNSFRFRMKDAEAGDPGLSFTR